MRQQLQVDLVNCYTGVFEFLLPNQVKRLALVVVDMTDERAWYYLPFSS